jgi:general stress protein YciG
MDGYEVVHLLAQHTPRLTRHRYIVLTANWRIIPSVFREQLQRLLVPVIPKPFDLDELLAAVVVAAARLHALPPRKEPTMSSRPAKAAPEGPATLHRVVRPRAKPGPKPGTEAARRGGRAARDKYGPEFYSKIGKKGGTTVRERRGSDFYAAIGKKGGQATRTRQGIEHYARIGRMGGKSAHAGDQQSTQDTQ